MRAPVDHITAPAFPPRAPWINSPPLRMEELLGRPVLIEFWDFCRPNSIRTLPYMGAWHQRYQTAGLVVIGVHASGFEPSGDPEAVSSAVKRLGVPYPVMVDSEFELWERYGNLGWPARYLFNQQGTLFDYHYGEGAYDETERAIQELLGIQQPVIPTLRSEDEPGALLAVQSEDVAGPFQGRYQAGAVWAVLAGRGSIVVNGRRIAVEHDGCYELVSHPRSTEGQLELELGDGVVCYGVCFTPGLAS